MMSDSRRVRAMLGVHDLVEHFLAVYPDTRNNDTYLYFLCLSVKKPLKFPCFHCNSIIDFSDVIRTVRYEWFRSAHANINPETVRRIRQKIQCPSDPTKGKYKPSKEVLEARLGHTQNILGYLEEAE